MVDRSLKRIATRHRAKIRTEAFVDLYAMRAKNPSLKIPAGMDSCAEIIGGMAGKSIEKNIREYARLAISEVDAEIADIQSKLKNKITKTAQKQLDVKLRKREKTLKSLQPATGDNYRIYPNYFVPAIIESHGAREIMPMRYRILPRNGVEVPPTYNVFNARRDTLQSARNWKPLFGRQHALFPFQRFYEWVQSPDGRKMEISFSPDGYSEMWAASLYEETLTVDGLIRSISMVTDEPPAEVRQAGHDRCPCFIREDVIDQWLQPNGKSLEALDALLGQKQPVYFSHERAA